MYITGKPGNATGTRPQAVRHGEEYLETTGWLPRRSSGRGLSITCLTANAGA